MDLCPKTRAVGQAEQCWKDRPRQRLCCGAQSTLQVLTPPSAVGQRPCELVYWDGSGKCILCWLKRYSSCLYSHKCPPLNGTPTTSPSPATVYIWALVLLCKTLSSADSQKFGSVLFDSWHQNLDTDLWGITLSVLFNYSGGNQASDTKWLAQDHHW